jgi:phage terminase large subunit
MQRQEYLVTKQSVNLIKELRQYAWDKDKTGTTLNKPAGGQDHAIDALRYHEMMNLGKPAREWFAV